MIRGLAIYAAGVATAPVWLYIFKKPLATVVAPHLMSILGDEDLDESLYTFMQTRLDYQDLKKRDERLKGQ